MAVAGAELAMPVDGRDGFAASSRPPTLSSISSSRRFATPPGTPQSNLSPSSQAPALGPVFHLQHYFSVPEVALALQHASAARQVAVLPPLGCGGHAPSCSAVAECRVMVRLTLPHWHCLFLDELVKDMVDATKTVDMLYLYCIEEWRK
ncbi:hypothetical protein ABZP36_021099 [Zizania latifolia]